MNQEKVVNHILRDLKFLGIIPEGCEGELRPYLMAIYCAGWEKGRLEINQHGNKTIGQYNRQGKLIQTYKSRKEASVKTGFSENGIYKSMINKRPTKQGWEWKYL